MIKAARVAGADRVRLADTIGVLTPAARAFLDDLSSAGFA
jgi:isopropylmalate/homocitrate/citramalate synthase